MRVRRAVSLRAMHPGTGRAAGAVVLATALLVGLSPTLAVAAPVPTQPTVAEEPGAGASASNSVAAAPAGPASAAQGSPGAAPPAPPAPRGGPSGFDAQRSRVDEGRTTATRREWVNPDGTRTVEVAAGPVRFRDQAGRWQDIDLSLVRDGAGRASGRSVPPGTPQIAGQAAGRLATIETGAGSFGLSHPDAAAVSGRGQDGDRRRVFPGALSGGRELRVGLVPGGIVEEVILPDAAAPASYRLQVDVPAGITAREAAGGVEFVDGQGRVRLVAGHGVAFDSAAVAAETPVQALLASDDGRSFSIDFAVDPKWLAAPERTFPVVVDPAIYYGTISGADNACRTVFDSYTGCDTYVNSDNLSGAYYTQTQLRAGSPGGQEAGATAGTLNRTRTFMQFVSDSYFPAASTTQLVSATFKVYNYGGYSPSTVRPFTAYSLASRVGADTTWSAQPSIVGSPAAPASSNGLFSGAVQEFGIANGWVTFNAFSAVSEWMSGARKPFGLAIIAGKHVGTTSAVGGSAERDRTYFRQFYSAENGSSLAPLLTWTVDDLPPTPINELPANEAVVADTTPTLQVRHDGLNSDDDPLQYFFRVLNSSGGIAVDSVWQSLKSWKVPAGKLSPGQRYTWQAWTSDGKRQVSGTSTAFTVNSAPPAASPSSPGNGAITASCTNTLSAGAVSDPQGQSVSYRFEVSTGSGFSSLSADSGFTGSTSFSFAGSAGSTYFWRVTSRDSMGATAGPSGTYSFTCNTPPSAASPVSPGNGAVLESASNELVVNPASDPQGQSVSYRFEVSTGSTFSALAADSGFQASTRFSFTGTAGFTYFWRVSTRDTSGAVTGSSFVWSFTLNSAPPAPARIGPAEGEVVPTTSPALQVGAVSDPQGQAVSYRFEVSTVSTFTSLVADSGFQTGTGFAVPAGRLLAGTTYFWRASSRDTMAASRTSAAWSFTVNSPPAAASALSPADGEIVPTTQPTLQVHPAADPQGQAVSYQFDVAADSAFGTVLHRSSYATSSSYQVPASTLAVGGKYFWRVRTRDSQGATTEPAFVRSFTVNSAPGAADPLRPADGEVVPNATPTLEVTAATDVDNQSLRYRFEVSSGGTFSTVAADSGFQSATGFTVPTGKLNAGITYFWRASTRDSQDATTASSFVRSFTVNSAPAAAVPDRPADQSTVYTTTPELVVQPATDPQGQAVSYRFEVASSSDFTASSVRADSGFVPGTSWRVPADRQLSVGSTYFWRVATRDSQGATTGSAFVWSFTVDEQDPPVVTKTVSAAEGSTGQAVTVSSDGSSTPAHAAGEAVRYTITVHNPNPAAMTVPQVVDTLPASLTTSGAVLRTGAVCLDCALSGRTLTLPIPNKSIPAGQSVTFSYTGVLTGSERDCLTDVVNTAVADSEAGPGQASSTTTVCGAGLGLEPWWSYVQTATGASSTALVNAANGNLVVSATDSTPVQARGRLGYVLRRTYNSQESTAATLPGSFGAGWLLNVGFSSDLAGAGVTPTGLLVPRLGQAAQNVTEPLAVTLADRDGTRHTFTPKLGLPALDVTALPAALRPTALTAPAGYGSVCLTTGYTPPPGVHLGLFRYVAVQPSDTADACGKLSATATQAADPQVVLGYVAVRPDRLRTEFAATGQLLSMLDGSGVELRYVYDGAGQDSGVVSGPLRYVYEPRSTDGRGTACAVTRDSAGSPSLTEGCRAFTFTYTGQDSAPGQMMTAGPASTEVRDPAGRITRYEFRKLALPAGVTGPVMLLTAVVNPPQAAAGSSSSDTVGYAYQGDPHSGGSAVDCGGSDLQLCAITDARGATTTFGYTRPTGDAASSLAGLGRVASVTDRRGTTTALSYPDRSRTLSVRGGSQQRAFLDLDEFGRAGRVVDGAPGTVDADYTAARDTLLTWDGPDSSSCTVPASARRENNLCRQVRDGGASPDEDTAWTYTADGMVLRSTARSGAPAGSGTPADLHTTFGYATQSWTRPAAGSGEAVQRSEHRVTGNGQHTSTPAPDPSSVLFTITDRIEQLSPRGNEPAPAEPYTRYRTSYTLDNSTAVAPNSVATAGPCTGPAGNTGLVCAVTVPHGPATAEETGSPGQAVTRYSYDTFGQRTSMRTPNAGATGTPYSYSYADGNRRDLSGTVSADGWLTAVTDPDGKFVAFAHDAAGNTVRTWDRNATAGKTLAEFPGTISSPTSDRYAQTLYATGTAAQAIAAPWRWAVSERIPTGDTTSRCLDAHGNIRLARPARGSSGQPIADCAAALDAPGEFDVLFDTATGGNAAPDDQPTSVLPPEQRAADQQPTTVDYDGFGNPTATTDPRGVPTRTRYDVVNRPVAVTVVRASTEAELAGQDADPNCPAGPDGASMCTRTVDYDMVDNAIRTLDADGAVSTATFNAVGWKTSTEVDGTSPNQSRDASSPTATAVTLRTSVRFDADGNATTVCPPRQMSAGSDSGGACTATGAFSRHHSFDPAGRMLTQTGYRAPGSPALVTRYGYDASGNPRVTVDANGHTTRTDVDALDRTILLTRPRSGSSTFSTTMEYDAVGNRTAVIEQLDTAGANRIDAFGYDTANRLVDTVTGASSRTAAAAGPATGTGNVRTRRVYDADGHLVGQYAPRAFAASTTDPDERFATWTDLDRNGRPVATFTPRHDSSTGTAGQGDSQSSECPNGQQPETRAGSFTGYPATVGVCVSRMRYDSADRVSALTLPTAGGAQPEQTTRQLTFGYTADGLRAKVSGPNPTGAGTVDTRTGFDGNGRPVTLVMPSAPGPDGMLQARSSTMTYTADGLLAVRTDPAPDPTGGTVTSRFGYDADGRQVRTVDPLGQTWTTSFTADGLTASTADPAGNTMRYEHDSVGNVRRLFDPSAHAGDATNPGQVPTVYNYTADNLLATEARPHRGDGNRLEVTWTYDGAGRKSTQKMRTVTGFGPGSPAETNPSLRTQVADGGTQRFTYAPADRLTVETGRGGETIQTSYDPDGNPLTIADSTTDAKGATSTLTSTFYLDGLLRSTADGARSTRYGYDAAGQVTVRSHTPLDPSAPGAGQSERTVFDYNDAGARIRTASSTAQPAGQDWTASYDPAGRLTREQAPNGQVTTHSWLPDDNLRTKRTVVDSTGNAALVAQWTYSYDNLGRQLTQDHSGQAVNGAEADNDHRYDYDPAGRVVGFADGPGASRAHTARYDANGNRTSYTTAGVGTQAVTYSPDNTLNSSTDLDGSNRRLSSYSPYGALIADGCYRYNYDGFDRLIRTEADPSVLRCATAATTRYAYDGLDRQRGRDELAAGTLPTQPLSTTGLHYDGLGTAVASETVTGGTGVSTDRAFTLDPTGAPLSLTNKSSTSLSSSTAYLTDDGTGTITTITGESNTASGFTTCTARFDPWGTPATAASTTQNGTPTQRGSNPCGSTVLGQPADSGNDRFYRSERRDPTMGNYQLGSRTYDPSRTGFLTPDSHRSRHPIADLALGTDPLTTNRYTYVNGDPLNYRDPTGHRPECGDPSREGCQGKNSNPMPRPHNSKTEANAQRYHQRERARQATAQTMKERRDADSLVYGNAGQDPAWGTADSGVVCDQHGCRATGSGSSGTGGPGDAWNFAAGFTPWLGDSLSAIECRKVDEKWSWAGAATCIGVVPFVPSIGKHLDEAAEAGGAASVRLGQAGETAVRGSYDIGPKATAEIGGRTRIFDGLNGEAVSEVKNVASQAYTRQLRDSLAYAQANGLRFDLYVRPDTYLTGPLRDAISSGAINLRFIP